MQKVEEVKLAQLLDQINRDSGYKLTDSQIAKARQRLLRSTVQK